MDEPQRQRLARELQDELGRCRLDPSVSEPVRRALEMLAALVTDVLVGPLAGDEIPTRKLAPQPLKSEDHFRAVKTIIDEAKKPST